MTKSGVLQNNAVAIGHPDTPYNLLQPRADGSVIAEGQLFDEYAAEITPGNSLSNPVDLTYRRLNALWIPAGFTPANLTFQSSPDGLSYGELVDDTGAAITVATAGASTFVILTKPSQWLGVRYLIVRSGTSISPVPQVADISILLFALP